MKIIKLLLSIIFLAVFVFAYPLTTKAATISDVTYCSDINSWQPAIPVSVTVNQGKATIVLQFSKMDYQTYLDSAYNQVPSTLYVLPLDSNLNFPQGYNSLNMTVNSDWPLVGGVLYDKTFNFYFTSTSSLGTYYVVVTDQDGGVFSTNPVQLTGCTFQQKPLQSFTITSTQNPGLSEGDSCPIPPPTNDPSLVCPSPLVCVNRDGLYTGTGQCTALVSPGGVCDPSLLYNPCGDGYSCKLVSGTTNSFTCQSTTAPPPTITGYEYTQAPFGDIVGAYGCGNGKNDVWTLDCVFPVLANVIFWLLSFSGIVAVIFIIIGGIRLVTANGDPKTINEARRTIEFAIIGLIVIFLSFFILAFIATTTGVACINPTQELKFTTCST